MIRIDELKEALKQINIGSAFSQFMPRAYYNMDDDSIVVCDLEIMTEFNNRYFDGTLSEEYINSSIETKALSEIYPNFFFIDCYISKNDLLSSFTETVTDSDLREKLKENCFIDRRFKIFKSLLLKNNLFDSYLNYLDYYYEKKAIDWCIDNCIPYEVSSCK